MIYPWLKARRWYLRRREQPAPFDALLAADLPSRSSPIPATEIVSLDIETTGLDASSAQMLSVGWVIVRNGGVDLSTAESFIVRPSDEVGQSATVHGLTDTVVGAGLDWGVILDKIVDVLAGRVLLVHYAGLDKTLLDRMCTQRFGSGLPVPVIDTLALEQRRLKRRHHLETDVSLRLADLREEYGLPRYAAHDCLVDAIATAELLLAITARRRWTDLGDLLG